VLSYLVPGLGQIYQGRVGKGLLFLVCIYTLFFYGQRLSSGSVTVGEQTYTLNGCVYIPDVAQEEPKPVDLPDLALNLWKRPQFVGQFWVGVAAWPAVLQYVEKKNKKDAALKACAAVMGRGTASDDERKEAEQECKAALEQLENSPGLPLLGRFEREPSASAINAVGNAGDKRLELGWVYTVIAGVLNIMVIYDAVAGPAFLLAGRDGTPKPQRALT
jgi:hypothetical protein